MRNGAEHWCLVTRIISESKMSLPKIDFASFPSKSAGFSWWFSSPLITSRIIKWDILSITVPFPFIRSVWTGRKSSVCSTARMFHLVCGSLAICLFHTYSWLHYWAFQIPSPVLLTRLCRWEDSRSNVLCFSSFCRIHLEDLSQSVLLHMTEKLGYKNSDVINTVLSNRASHTLAIYFLLNKKLERYLASLRVSTAWCWFFGQAGERVKKCLKVS